jgi:hypothetical protein
VGYVFVTVGAKFQPCPGRTGAHTNTTEATWKHVKVFLNAYNRQTNYIYYLSENMLASLCRARAIDPFTMFLLVITHVDWALRPTDYYYQIGNFNAIGRKREAESIVLPSMRRAQVPQGVSSNR